VSGSEREMEYKLLEKKIRDMIIYNNQMVVKFPKHEKFLMANKIRELGYCVLELCIVCNKKVHKKTTLTELNIAHELLRQFVNLALESRYINYQKHKTASLFVDEVGKMVGAWVKKEMGIA
jgi:hypothetical protein